MKGERLLLRGSTNEENIDHILKMYDIKHIDPFSPVIHTELNSCNCAMSEIKNSCHMQKPAVYK